MTKYWLLPPLHLILMWFWVAKAETLVRLLPLPQYLPISGESSEFPSLTSIYSDPVAWQMTSMLMNVMLTNVPVGNEMRYTQSAKRGYGFGYEGEVRTPLAFV